VEELNKVSKGLKSLDFKSNPRAILTKEYAMVMFPVLKKLNGEQVREST
jgi:hypothetical protein